MKSSEVLESILKDFEKPKITIVGPGEEGPDESVYWFLMNDNIDLTIVDCESTILKYCERDIKRFMELNKLTREPKFIHGSAYTLDQSIQEMDMIFYHDMVHLFHTETRIAEVIASSQTSMSEKGKTAFVFMDYEGKIMPEIRTLFTFLGYTALRKQLQAKNIKYEEKKIKNEYVTKPNLKTCNGIVYKSEGVLQPNSCNKMLIFGKDL